MRAIQKRISKTKWYRQGGALTLFYISAVLVSVRETFKPVNFFKGKNAYNYFDKTAEKRIAKQLLENQVKDQAFFSRHYISPWRLMQKEMAEFFKRITPQYLHRLSEKALLKEHDTYNHLRVRSWAKSVAIEPLDPWGDILLKEWLRKKKARFNEQDILALTGQQTLHYRQREAIAKIRLALAKKGGTLTNAALQRHFANWYWIENSWHQVRYLTPDYFLKRIHHESRKSTKKLKHDMARIVSQIVALKRRRSQLARKYRIPKDLAIILKFFRLLTDWRDERKARLLQENQTADLFLKEFSKRSGIAYELLEFLNAWEVTSLNKIRKSVHTLRKRQKACLFYYQGSKIRWHYGADAIRLHTLLQNRIHNNEISGQVANRGKVIGKVQKIITHEDFEKLKRNAIIVTQMTRPEFAPLLKKAAAIITDEGGITCHAAIISRELNIPCIIGTQNATTVLKNGDRVEVDAINGLVKKI